MNQRILRVELRDRVLNPVAAEVLIVVRVDACNESTHLRGRLTGPRCQFANTVEVAYPLRPLPVPVPIGPDELVARVVIPEASLWDLQSPFFYGGPVELWEDDRLCERIQVRHGLRIVRFGPRGVSINGRPVTVRGKEVAAVCPDDEALRLRHAGYNLLLAPVRETTIPLWDMGDRLGFLVVGRVDSVDAETRDRVAVLGRHPSSAGWLARAEDLPGETILSPDTVGLLGPID
jgi:hypothetical protein